MFIFVFQLSFIDCILSKIVGFDQFWTAFQQKLATANSNLVFFKMPNTFCQFTVQNCCYFLQWYTAFYFIDFLSSLHFMKFGIFHQPFKVITVKTCLTQECYEKSAFNDFNLKCLNIERKRLESSFPECIILLKQQLLLEISSINWSIGKLKTYGKLYYLTYKLQIIEPENIN